MAGQGFDPKDFLFSEADASFFTKLGGLAPLSMFAGTNVH